MLSLFSGFHVIQFLIFVSYDNALPSHVASQRLDFLVPNLCPSYAQDSSSCFFAMYPCNNDNGLFCVAAYKLD